jgi:hypothetical protein
MMSMGNVSMGQGGSEMVPQFALRANRGYLSIFPESLVQSQIEWDAVEFVWCVKGGKYVLPPRTAGNKKQNQLAEFHEWVAKKHGVSQQSREVAYDSPTSRKNVFKTALHCAARTLKKAGIFRADLPYDAWEFTEEGIRLAIEAFGPQQSGEEQAESQTSDEFPVSQEVLTPSDQDARSVSQIIVQVDSSQFELIVG